MELDPDFEQKIMEAVAPTFEKLNVELNELVDTGGTERELVDGVHAIYAKYGVESTDDQIRELLRSAKAI